MNSWVKIITACSITIASFATTTINVTSKNILMIESLAKHVSVMQTVNIPYHNFASNIKQMTCVSQSLVDVSEAI